MKNRPLTTIAAFLFVISVPAFAGVNEDLITACRQGDMDGVKKAVNAGADVNFKGADGATPISSAYFWPDITQFLLDKKADPNGSNYPALLSAASSYSTEVMKKLLDARADPNKPGVVDGTAVLKTLIEKEKAKGKDGNPALIKAWEGGAQRSQTDGGLSAQRNGHVYELCTLPGHAFG